MRSTLRKPLAAALLLSSAAALLAQPAFARDHRYVVVEPAATPATVYVRDGDYDRGWRNGWRRDAQGPIIDDLTPQPGALMGDRRATRVSASFTDPMSGIDLATVRLRLDGRDVTGYATIDPLHIRIDSDLAPGRHVAEVLVRDRAGNLARRSWQFDVQGHYGEGYGRPYGWRR